MKRLILIFSAAVLFAGCASSDSTPGATQKDTSQKTDPNGNKVSEIPWNRPQQWENTGQLGGAMGN